MEALTATAQITINVPAAKVWNALVDPQLVKQYLSGTTVVSDWRKGSPIAYKGEWEGRPYEDKGMILEVEPTRLLKTTYFSSFSGLEDKPENYQVVTYSLHEKNGMTTVTVTHEGNKTQADVEHAETNWKMVLESMKRLLEEQADA